MASIVGLRMAPTTRRAQAIAVAIIIAVTSVFLTYYLRLGSGITPADTICVVYHHIHKANPTDPTNPTASLPLFHDYINVKPGFDNSNNANETQDRMEIPYHQIMHDLTELPEDAPGMWDRMNAVVVTKVVLSDPELRAYYEGTVVAKLTGDKYWKAKWEQAQEIRVPLTKLRKFCSRIPV